MKEVVFDTNTVHNSYRVLIGDRLEAFSDELISCLRGKRVMILTDSGTRENSFDAIIKLLRASGVGFETALIPSGEQAKSFDALQAVLKALADGGFGRNDIMINLGGGVVGDLGGFAAAIYMRGINSINIPTTLLSMIDSSMGGKTGIDFLGIKNAVGAFHQPVLVLCACEFLSTLSPRELRSGFGEALKYYCISGSGSIKNALLSGTVTPDFIRECCMIKREYVTDDVLDSGKRRILNLGHTFGHAFEAASGFSLTHGEAVCMGLIAAARFGERLGITQNGAALEIEALSASIGLGTDYSEYSVQASAFLMHDKKSASGEIEMAFLERIGKPFLKRVSLGSAASFLTEGAGYGA